MCVYVFWLIKIKQRENYFLVPKIFGIFQLVLLTYHSIDKSNLFESCTIAPFPLLSPLYFLNILKLPFCLEGNVALLLEGSQLSTLITVWLPVP